MKKILLTLSVLFLTIGFITCSSKDPEFCYTCYIGGPGGRVLDTCSSVTSNHYIFKDQNGNTQSWYCNSR